MSSGCSVFVFCVRHGAPLQKIDAACGACRCALSQAVCISVCLFLFAKLILLVAFHPNHRPELLFRFRARVRPWTNLASASALLTACSSGRKYGGGAHLDACFLWRFSCKYIATMQKFSYELCNPLYQPQTVKPSSLNWA